MGDKFKHDPIGLAAPLSNFFAVVPSDATVLTQATRGIYVGTAGDLTVVGVNDSAPVTFKAAAVGWHPIRAKMIMETGTVADDIVGGY